MAATKEEIDIARGEKQTAVNPEKPNVLLTEELQLKLEALKITNEEWRKIRRRIKFRAGQRKLNSICRRRLIF
jgi:hypothetical protein